MSRYLKIKKIIFDIIETGKPGDHASRIFDVFIVTLIVLNITAIIIESFEVIDQQYHLFFRVFEIVSIVIFTIEFLLRICAKSAANLPPIPGINCQFSAVFRN